MNGKMSVGFYNEFAESYAKSTKNVDMTENYIPFLSLLGKGAHILDAGCGSGRDARFFLNRGFRVTAMDASNVLAKIAVEWTGLEVEVCSFEEFIPSEPMDAIWACASLLHVPAAELPLIFSHLSECLKENGLFYCSFKYGREEYEKDGRWFTNCDEKRLSEFIRNSSLLVRKEWISSDVRPDRADEKWLNALLIKK